MAGAKSEHRRVLVVEDDDAIVRVLRLSLRNNGYETARAATGCEALKAMDDHNFDAVILDLSLPDGCGGDVLRRLQSMGHRLPWIVMSAIDEREAIERFGPMQGPFIAKPFDLWDLIRTLDELTNGDPAGDARAADSAS